MKLSELILVDPAQTVARELQQQWPCVEFTSGRRDIETQASDMAQNVCLNRRWVQQTYVRSVASVACQAAVDAHPEARLPSEIAAELLLVLQALTEDEMEHLSLHLIGCAFDVAPMSIGPNARAWLVAQAEKYGGKVLFHEGGLEKCHFQARPQLAR